MKVVFKGATGSSQLREFFCPPCAAHFDAFSKRDDSGDFEKRTHSCGNLCEAAKFPKAGTRMAIRGKEPNAIPSDLRKVFQRQFGLNDDQMSKVSREDMDRVMKARGLHFTPISYDENVNGGRRARGEAVELPPETDDPAVVDAFNAKKHGDGFVQAGKERSRAAFESLQRGDPAPKLPEATEVGAHATPHMIDVEKTVEAIESAPVVALK